MPQIILYEWKNIFSGSLLHKTPTPWSGVLLGGARLVEVAAIFRGTPILSWDAQCLFAKLITTGQIV